MSTETAEPAVVIENQSDKIQCLIDNAMVHSIEIYIRNFHSPEWTKERYVAEFPDAPLFSAFAQNRLTVIRNAKAQQNLSTSVAARAKSGLTLTRKPFNEVFGLGNSPAAMNERSGQAIPVAFYEGHDQTDANLVPDIDPNYVFDIELTKSVLIAMELNFPMLLWGLHGTGKTTLGEQFCARTGRPFMRVPHTVNTEEAHIVGQYIVREVGGVSVTEFQLGPLPTAMINGYVYCADEYDIASPAVLSVYQSVLEGKPLLIKDAPPALRLVRPHPNFRFIATGNTNGGGDETGLYQGTQIQNAANYSRFRITEEVGYMAPNLEIAVVAGQAAIDKKEAKRLVEFANMVREQFRAGKIGSTVSPRELISAGLLGRVRGGKFRIGLRQAFINRLSRVDKEAVEMLAQRLFGNE